MSKTENPSPQPKAEIRHGLETGAAKPDNASETAGGPAPKPQAPANADLVEMIRERFGSSFDNEATFDGDEIEAIISALTIPPPQEREVGNE